MKCLVFAFYITKHGNALYIGMAKVLPIIDVFSSVLVYCDFVYYFPCIH